mmetsp:Transcript_11383/g.19116  ORF Transcript_11383/g.19116 Transcript_11383/m.19116 type:complete len:163 (-) Transcript_11383:39-527(-)
MSGPDPPPLSVTPWLPLSLPPQPFAPPRTSPLPPPSQTPPPTPPPMQPVPIATINSWAGTPLSITIGLTIGLPAGLCCYFIFCRWLLVNKAKREFSLSLRDLSRAAAKRRMSESVTKLSNTGATAAGGSSLPLVHTVVVNAAESPKQGIQIAELCRHCSSSI